MYGRYIKDGQFHGNKYRIKTIPAIILYLIIRSDEQKTFHDHPRILEHYFFNKITQKPKWITDHSPVKVINTTNNYVHTIHLYQITRPIHDNLTLTSQYPLPKLYLLIYLIRASNYRQSSKNVMPLTHEVIFCSPIMYCQACFAVYNLFYPF